MRLSTTLANDTDSFWQSLGNDDPYWGVLTADEFRKDKLTQESVEEFYVTGERDVDFIFQVIHKYLDEDFTPNSVRISGVEWAGFFCLLRGVAKPLWEWMCPMACCNWPGRIVRCWASPMCVA